MCTACAAGTFALAADNSCATNKAATDCAAGTFFATGTDITGPDGTCTSCTAATDWDHDTDPATPCQAVTVTANCLAGFEIFVGDATTDKGCVGCPVGKIQVSATGTACTNHAAITCTAGQQANGGTPSTVQEDRKSTRLNSSH